MERNDPVGKGAIDADAVYATTGQPRPQDIEAIAGVLLNSPFQEAVEKVSAIKTEGGLALADIARLLCDYVFRLHMPPSARAELVSQMADVEHRLAYVTHERLQLLAWAPLRSLIHPFDHLHSSVHSCICIHSFIHSFIDRSQLDRLYWSFFLRCGFNKAESCSGEQEGWADGLGLVTERV